MKKNHLVLLGFLVFVFFSCKKTEIPNAEEQEKVLQTSKDYIIEDGLVKFTSFDSYRNILDNKDNGTVEAFINDVKNNTAYKPMLTSTDAKQRILERNKQNSRLVYGSDADLNDDIEDMLSSPFFASIINSVGLVQIGNYIFNIDLVNNRCYAMHTSWLNANNASYYYNLIYNGDTTSNYVFNFSTGDDVLDRLEEFSYPTTKQGIVINTSKLFCRESGVPRAKLKELEEGFEYGSAKCKVVYQKAGIYFALFGKIKVTDGLDFLTPATVFRARYAWRFKPKCWNERIQNYTISPYDNVVKRYAWESTRALNKYQIGFQWDINFHTLELATTRQYYIADGY